MQQVESNVFFRRLSLGFHTLVFALFFISLISLLALRSVVKSQDVLTSDHGVDLLNIQKLQILVEKKVSRSRAYLISFEDRFLREMIEVRKDFLDLVDLTKPGIRNERTKRLFDQVTKAEKEHNEALEKVVNLAKTNASRNSIVTSWEQYVRPKRTDLDIALNELIEDKESIYENAIRTSQSAARFSTMAMAATAFFAVILSFILLVLIRRSLSHLMKSEIELKGTTSQLLDALKMRDEFLSIASHELKTPLTSMKLKTQMHKRLIIKDQTKALELGRIKKFIEQVEFQILRITRLIDNMLDVSKIRSGKLTLQREMVDLCVLTSEVIEKLKDQFKEALGLLPEVTVCEGGKGYWDPARIEQVISNLLTNALKYGERKPIDVSITANEQKVWLKIRDRGMGISEESLSRIFRRFERSIDASEVSGLGLGLYISKQIIDAHGGKIEVESQTGAGSTFIVELPKK